MEKNIFPYTWHIDTTDDENTTIRIYGLDEENNTVCIKILDFTPYCYVELSENVVWDSVKVKKLVSSINTAMRTNMLNYKLTYKYKLYYAHIDKNGNRKKFPYLFVCYPSVKFCKFLRFKLMSGINVMGMGKCTFKVFEHDSNPITQLITISKINSSHWFKIKYNKNCKQKSSKCKYEYNVSYRNISDCGDTIKKLPRPGLFVFDIESYSSIKGSFCDARRSKDKIFQISIVIGRLGAKESEFEKYILCLFDMDRKVIKDDDVNLLVFKDEMNMLLKFCELLGRNDVNIVSGYNILGFDIQYIIDRCKLHNIFGDLASSGFSEICSGEKKISWSSSARKNQEFKFIDLEGKLYFDLYPIVQSTYTLAKYSLDFVANYFMKENKDPLSFKGIFAAYEMANNDCQEFGKLTKKGLKAISICAKYCLKDTVLVLRLLDKLKTWVTLVEMSKTCFMPMFDVYTRGQQLKMYCTLYNYCTYNNIVVETNVFVADDSKFQGAHVKDPKSGIYHNVVPFDFSGLYPSIMMAYNIDFSTLAIDKNIPDEMCHVEEWEEHIGCKHDQKRTETEKKKIKNKSCGIRRFRFLKTEKYKGALPSILEYFISGRARVRSVEIKGIKKELENNKELTQEQIDDYNDQLIVLDKKQLSYKLAANSIYGAMGVKRGKLPLTPGAMTVTAIGRRCIKRSAKEITEVYGGELIYIDTDSNYVIFHDYDNKPAHELWDYCLKVSKNVSDLFPSVLKILFEEKIYKKFIILTKKRYMYLEQERNGEISKKIGRKGVLIARRDNSKACREIYEEVVRNIFNGNTEDEIKYNVLCNLNRFFHGGISIDDLVITKSVGDVDNFNITQHPTEENKVYMGDYKLPKLEDDDEKERLNQLRKKDATCAKEFYIRWLPAQVQLAVKMRERGDFVPKGSRLEYIVTDTGNLKDKQYNKIEDVEFYKLNCDSIKIDYLYYTKYLIKCIDEILDGVYEEKGFMKKMYKYREQKYKLCREIEKLFKIDFIIDE